MQTEPTQSRRAPLPASLHDPLIERGFAFNGAGYRQDDLRIDVVGRWLVLGDEANGQGAFSWPPLTRQVALWKYVQNVPNGTPPRRVFEIPRWAVHDSVEEDRFDDDQSASFGRLLDWAVETSSGRVPAAWVPPARELVESWLPRGALTVQANGLVRQGELILRPDRWALRIPLMPDLPQDLPEPRQLALEELVRDAQALWAMVRLAMEAGAGSHALVAEVDLTGAPYSETLFSAGLDVLRHAIARLLETAEVLADASVALESLAVDSPLANLKNPNERKQP